jgi:hypothetical protein
MIKGALIFVLCALLWGCENVEVKKEYYGNGKLMSRTHLVKGIIDTLEYYYPNGSTRRILYEADGKVKNDLISESWDHGKFNSFHRTQCATIYADKDSIILGEKYEAKIFLVTPYPDSIKYIMAEVGDSNLGMTNIKYIDTLPIVREDHFLIYAKYSIIPRHAGMYKFYGLIRCILPNEHFIVPYPFCRAFLVKEK